MLLGVTITAADCASLAYRNKATLHDFGAYEQGVDHVKKLGYWKYDPITMRIAIRKLERVGFQKCVAVSGFREPLCKAISNYININPTAFTLGTLPTAANRSSPTLWLVANIPDPLAQVVVDARMLSSTSITVYTLPYNMPIMGFVGVFAGFTLPNTVMSANTAWGLIGTAIKANNKIAQFVQPTATHLDPKSPLGSLGEPSSCPSLFMASSSSSMTPTPSHGTSTSPPPTNDRKSWSQLHCLFGRLYGTAQLQEAFRCHISVAAT
ncbi:hypothetical protein B0H14DRAFT_2575771 [Mycena olivaceomarginata]|nr:hypothetical protein B0H14DRAFT_2575771 [Mycena olivaceomarginata]